MVNDQLKEMVAVWSMRILDLRSATTGTIMFNDTHHELTTLLKNVNTGYLLPFRF
jgi:hypothetical protein